MKDSGSKRVFATGAVRDSAEGKPRMELLPLDLLMKRLSPWYAEGAKKYKDNNWRKGQPQSAVLGSLLRHLTKWQMGMTDEDHLAAVVWNALSLLNADEYYKDNPAVCDIIGWFDENGKPTGKGSYENEQYHLQKEQEEFCPNCGRELQLSEKHFMCHKCDTEFIVVSYNPLNILALDDK